jgi:hypothetical protein
MMSTKLSPLYNKYHWKSLWNIYIYWKWALSFSILSWVVSYLTGIWNFLGDHHHGCQLWYPEWYPQAHSPILSCELYNRYLKFLGTITMVINFDTRNDTRMYVRPSSATLLDKMLNPMTLWTLWVSVHSPARHSLGSAQRVRRMTK